MLDGFSREKSHALPIETPHIASYPLRFISKTSLSFYEPAINLDQTAETITTRDPRVSKKISLLQQQQEISFSVLAGLNFRTIQQRTRMYVPLVTA